MAACEKCWADSKVSAFMRGVPQANVYRELVSRRECTPEEQCGQMHLVLNWKDGSRRCRCGKVVEAKDPEGGRAMSVPLRKYKVGTFYHPDDGRLCISRIRAYTRWYNPEWQGCVEFEVEAKNGTKAKQLASQKRLEMEMAKVPEGGR